MKNRRYILRYTGTGSIPSDEMTRIKKLVTLLDASSKMLLVEGEPASLKRLIPAEADWIVVPETTFRLPDARQRIKK